MSAADFDKLVEALQKIAGDQRSGLAGEHAWEKVKIARDVLTVCGCRTTKDVK